MSWRKYFTPVEFPSGKMSPISGSSTANPSRANYSSFLPDVYSGHPNRLERYSQYDTMDSDSEVNAALDILAEFCTQLNDDNATPFHIFFKDQATPTEVKVIKKYLQQWSKQNKFSTRIFRIIRNTFKYGDAFFVRDPETLTWLYVDSSKVDKIIVNESDGKAPEQYVIRDLNINFQNLTVSQINPTNQNSTPGGTAYVTGGAQQRGMVGAYPQGSGSRFSVNQNQCAIEAQHVVHLSMSDGMDNNFPFGNSILESIFKVYKQKELLEDAIIIYRIQRAPERRIFYVDVGNMPSHLAMSFVERVKQEVNQRRIPSASGGGQSMIDASYNPLAVGDDYFFPTTAEGRGSKVETLPGGTNLGEIDDLRFFTNKLFRALRIPSSYLPTGADDGSTSFNDGRVGTAYIQELRFNKYCERLQSLVCGPFDDEFKAYLLGKGINVDFNLFDLKFNPPQNFAAYRQSEMDTARVATYTTMAAIPHISKRFALKRFLGLTAEEIAENEEQWRDENVDAHPSITAQAELRGAGITASGLAGDIGAYDEIAAPTEETEAMANQEGMPGAAPGQAGQAGQPGAPMPNVPNV